MDNPLELFRKEHAKQLDDLKPTDIQLFANKAAPKTYSLIIRPDETTKKKIAELAETLRSIERNQLYYSGEMLHLTLIGGVQPMGHEEEIVNGIAKTLSKYSLASRLGDLGSNEFGPSLTAYPIDFDLHLLREELRVVFGNHGSDYSKHLQHYEYVGWINLMRYIQIPSMNFIDLIKKLSPNDLGVLNPQSIELLESSDKLHRGARLIKKFL